MTEPNLDKLERRADGRLSIIVDVGDWLALLSRVRAAERERDEAKAKNRQTYCAFCSAAFPVDDSAEEVSKHIATCPKHPMRQVEAECEKWKGDADYQRRQKDALQLELDCLNAAMREGEAARKELGKEESCQDQ